MSTDDARPPVLLVLERELWIPAGEWRAAVTALEARFARARPLDAGAVLDAPSLAAQLAALAAWAREASVDLDTELGRWFDEHLAMHVRPDPVRTRAVRAIAATRPLHVASALPPRPAEGILRHAGAWRSVSQLHAAVADDAQLEQLRAALGAEVVGLVQPS